MQTSEPIRPQEPVIKAFFATKSSLTQGGKKELRVRTSQILVVSVAALAALYCVFNWITMLATFGALHVTLPVWDYWRVPQHLNEILRCNFGFLWEQHNEHRIVLPEIVFVLDVLCFHGLRWLPAIVSCACYLASWLLLASPLLGDRRHSWWAKLLIASAAGAFIGWKGAALALADPFLLQWTLLSCAVLLALRLLPGLPRGGNWRLTWIIFGAISATYSSGNGMLLWPLLVAGAILLGCSRSRISVLIASGAVSIALYSLGYRFAANSQWGSLIAHPLYALEFIAMHFSMPFGSMKSSHFGLYIGFCNLLLFASLLFAAIRSRTWRAPTALITTGWYVFYLLSTIVIAAGRMNPSDPTFSAAKADRYLAPVMLTWGALVVLLLWQLSRLKRFAIMPATAALLLVLLLVSGQKLKWWLAIGERPFIAAQVAELSIENGIFDPRLVTDLFPSPDFVRHYLPAMKAARISIFYRNPTRFLGKPLRSFAAPSSIPRNGAISRVLPISGGFEIAGWCALSKIGEVVVGSPEGKILGIGKRLPSGLPTELVDKGVASDRTWLAFVPDQLAKGSFRIYVAVDAGRKQLFVLSQTKTFPLVRPE